MAESGSEHSNKKNVQLVKVYARQRPFTKSELELRTPSIVYSWTSTELFLKAGNVDKKYCFEKYFGPQTCQTEIYDTVVSPLIDSLVSGYTCTVFAYGQTGTGKTYTMLGHNNSYMDFPSDPSLGMAPRAVVHTFAALEKLQIQYSVRVSFLEIYNEEVRDLLINDGAPLKIYDDPESKGATCVKGLSERNVANINEVFRYLNIGALERQTAATNLNRSSSRSHTVFTLIVNTREFSADGQELLKTGKLHLIDLAGSENIGRSGATDMRAREAGTINKSLLTLAKVIKALALKMPHVPYRESKLTRILQDSLGGKSQTRMICTFSPTIECLDETVSTLDYANIARSVANTPTITVNKSQTNRFTFLQNELAKLKRELNAAREGEGFYMKQESYEKMHMDIEQQNERRLNLLKQIQYTEDHMNTIQDNYKEMYEAFEKTKAQIDSLNNEIEREEMKQKETNYVAGYIQESLIEAEEVADALLTVAKSATIHEEIYHQKYERQIDKALHNAQIAQNVCKTSLDILKETQNKTEISETNTHSLLTKVQEIMHIVQSDYSTNSVKLDQLTSVILKELATHDLNFHSLIKNDKYNKDQIKNKTNEFFYSNYQKQLEQLEKIETVTGEVEGSTNELGAKSGQEGASFDKSMRGAFVTVKEHGTALHSHASKLNESLVQRQRNLNKRIKHNRKSREMLALQIANSQEKITSLKEDRESIQREEEICDAILKQIDGKHLELLKIIGTHFQKFNIFIKASTKSIVDGLERIITILQVCIVCQDENKSHEKASKDYFNNLFKILEEELHQYNEKIDDAFKTFAGSLVYLKKDLENTTDVQNSDFEALLEHLLESLKVDDADMEKFLQKCSKDVEEMASNVETRVHEGDTPIKPVYSFPKNLPTPISQEALKEEFRKVQVEENNSFSSIEEPLKE